MVDCPGGVAGLKAEPRPMGRLKEEKTMRAAVFHAPGGPEVLRYEEMPTPEPGPGSVRIKVKAAGVNRRDLWVRQGAFGTPPDPHIPGSDAAGEIDALGAGVKGVEEGQRVVINPGISCGRCAACLAGDHPACSAFSLVEGTYAEYVVVPAANVVPMPSGLTFAEAASIGIPFVTAESAWLKAGVKPGHTVAIWGASGGLGVAAIELAKLRGARVIALTRKAAKTERLKKLGAHEVVVVEEGRDVDAQIRDLTADRGLDAVLDSVGVATFSRSLGWVRRGGAVIAVGSTSGGEVAFPLGSVFRRAISIHGVYLGSSAILPRLLPLFARGQLMPVIDRVYPLEQADQAHEELEQETVVGKLILET